MMSPDLQKRISQRGSADRDSSSEARVHEPPKAIDDTDCVLMMLSCRWAVWGGL